MICRKAFERDLAAFVIDPRDPTWAEFREHYPTCPDCAGEVRVWTELQVELQSGDGERGPHPSKELLLSYEERRETLQPAELHVIEGHLAACHACTDELRALRRFDFSVLRRPVPRQRERSWHLVRELLSWPRAVVWHPAFAYALVLVILYPTLMHLRRAGDSVPTEVLGPEQRIALESTAPASVAQPRVATEVGESASAERLAAGDASQRSEAESLLAVASTLPRNTTPPLEQPGRLAQAGGGRPSSGAKGSAPKQPETRALGRAKPAVPSGKTVLAKPAPADRAATGEHAGANEPRMADGRGDGSDDTEASGALAARAPSEEDSGEPRVLGFAEARGVVQAKKYSDDAKHDQQVTGLFTVPEETGTGGAWQAVMLAPDRTPEVQINDRATGVSLRLPSSTLPSAARDIEVRVVGPGGREMAREMFQSPLAEHVEIRIGASELAAGAYRVLARGLDGGAPSDQAAEFLFVVR